MQFWIGQSLKGQKILFACCVNKPKEVHKNSVRRWYYKTLACILGGIVFEGMIEEIIKIVSLDWSVLINKVSLLEKKSPNKTLSRDGSKIELQNIGTCKENEQKE